MTRLAGKVALVTGSGRGLGRVIALRLASEGAALVVNYAASRAGAEEVAAEIEAGGGRAIAIGADIARHTEVIAMFAEIDRVFGRIDIIVNSAGISAGGPLAELDEEVLEKMLGTNLRGPLFVASEAAKRLPEGGRIGRAEEIAAVVAFLCSPEASWVSGTHILANGAANA